MKTTKRMILVALSALFTLGVSAQQVTTVYFLENAPMRHTINPAFQPYLSIISGEKKLSGPKNNSYPTFIEKGF